MNLTPADLAEALRVLDLLNAQHEAIEAHRRWYLVGDDNSAKDLGTLVEARGKADKAVREAMPSLRAFLPRLIAAVQRESSSMVWRIIGDIGREVGKSDGTAQDILDAVKMLNATNAAQASEIGRLNGLLGNSKQEVSTCQGTASLTEAEADAWAGRMLGWALRNQIVVQADLDNVANALMASWRNEVSLAARPATPVGIAVGKDGTWYPQSTATHTFGGRLRSDCCECGDGPIHAKGTEGCEHATRVEAEVPRIAPREVRTAAVRKYDQRIRETGSAERPPGDPRVDYTTEMRPPVMGGECARCFHRPPLHEPTCPTLDKSPPPDLDAMYKRRGDLADQIDAEAKTTRVDLNLRAEHDALSKKIAEVEKARRGSPKIKILPVEPAGIEGSPVFVDGPGLHEMQAMERPVYPPSPCGAILRANRQNRGVSIGDLARTLGISPADVSGLERGSVTTDDDGWPKVFAAVDATPPTWDPEGGRPLAPDPLGMWSDVDASRPTVGPLHTNANCDEVYDDRGVCVGGVTETDTCCSWWASRPFHPSMTGEVADRKTARHAMIEVLATWADVSALKGV